nr:uncharacterized protein LOC103448735 isoform X2 [Malus domestica]
MAPVPNTRPDGDDEDPRPIKQPRLGEAEDSKEEKPKPEPDADPKALDDQSPLVEVEDEPADTNPVAPNDQEPVPNEQSPPGEAEDDPADFVEEPLRCSICMEEGHSYMSCPLTWFCPPETAVSDLAEIVCYCCCERIDSGVHSNIPARMTRAQLIPRWPRCMPDVDTKALELELHTKQPQLGEAEDVKEEKPKPDPMALDDDQALQPTKQSPLVEAEDEPTDFVEESLRCFCMEAGHGVMSCPLPSFYPPETVVSDLAEIVFCCCCERIDSGVQLIPRWPRARSFPCGQDAYQIVFRFSDHVMFQISSSLFFSSCCLFFLLDLRFSFLLFINVSKKNWHSVFAAFNFLQCLMLLLFLCTEFVVIWLCIYFFNAADDDDQSGITVVVYIYKNKYYFVSDSRISTVGFDEDKKI